MMKALKANVLQIIKSLGRGGAETLLAETLKFHDKNKYEMHYAYFLPWKDAMVNSLKENGGTVVCFNAGNNISLIMKARAVARYVKMNNIQLIHAHLPWAGVLARIVGRMTGVPVIYTEHNKQERYHRLTYLLNRFTFNWQKKVIAVSGDVAESIEKNVRPGILVQTILNGVDTDFFVRSSDIGYAKRKELGLPDEAIIVGTIAVFRFQKRITEWLEVMARLRQLYPNAYGIIVGGGPLEQEILEKRKSLGLEQSVIMAGPQSDVKPWLSAFDIYMVTSIFEGLPIALLEAMSSSCAVVTTDAGGIRQLIRHNTDGLMTSTENWEELVQFNALLISDPARRTQLSAAARERVVHGFSVRRMVDELENVYNELIVS